MSPIMLAVSTIDGMREVRAWTTTTAGLAVHQDIGLHGEPLPDRWTVTHVRSGLAVGSRPDPESAMLLASELDGLTDWTQSGHDIRACLGSSYRGVVAAAGVDLGGHTGHGATPEALAR